MFCNGGDTRNGRNGYNMYRSLSAKDRPHGYTHETRTAFSTVQNNVSIPSNINKEKQLSQATTKTEKEQAKTETETSGSFSLSKPTYSLNPRHRAETREVTGATDSANRATGNLKAKVEISEDKERPDVKTQQQSPGQTPTWKNNVLKKPLRNACISRFSFSGDDKRLIAKPNDNIPNVKQTKPTNRFRKPSDDTFDVAAMGRLVQCKESIGLLVADGWTGTCFRVGDRYVMTAYHLMENVLRKVTSGMITTDDWEKCVFVCFGYTEPYKSEPKQNKFVLLSKPVFQNIEKDVLVLELKNEGIEFPTPLRLDAYSVEETNAVDFYLLGHPQGEQMKVDPKCTIVSLAEKTITEAIAWCQETFGRNGYEGVGDPAMLYFHCRFQHGASGSPGLAIGPYFAPRVVTMLLKGYPSFFWDIQEDDRHRIPNHFLLEQGIRMNVVRQMMLIDESLQDVVMNIFPKETTV